jgi:uncharacterized repeat protein (TIGR01451 family)
LATNWIFCFCTDWRTAAVLHQNNQHMTNKILQRLLFLFLAILGAITSNIAQTGSIAGVAYFDQNRNGLMSIDEQPISGNTIELYTDNNNDGIPDLPMVQRKFGGNFTFSNVPPGRYMLRFTPISGYLFSGYGFDSAIYELSPLGFTPSFDLVAGEFFTNNNFGIMKCFTDVQANITDAQCQQNTGAIELANLQMPGPLNYAWSNSASTQNLSNLAAGTYTVTVYSSDWCRVKKTFVVGNSDGPSPSADIIAPTCSGSTLGSISLSVSGGVATYDYAWSNSGGNTASINNLQPGTYTVTLTDQASCSIVREYLMPVSTEIPIQTTIQQPCFGANNGSITVTPTGGGGPFTYTWNNTSNTSPTYDNISRGNYNVVVTNAAGCGQAHSIEVAGVQIINADIKMTYSKDCNIANDTLVAQVISGGAPPFQYLWSNGASTEKLTDLISGVNYTVTIWDNNSCSVSIAWIFMDLNKPEIAVSNTPTQCGISVGSVFANATEGIAPYTFTWNTPNTTNLPNGNYQCTVTDEAGCTDSGNTIVVNTDGPPIDMVVSPIKCDGAPGFITLANQQIGDVYIWSNASSSDTIFSSTQGMYSVTITSAAGCSNIGEAIFAEPATYCSALGGQLWFDDNINGVRDVGELAAANIDVEVFSNGVLYNTVQTNANGDFLQDGLPFGFYSIKIKVPVGFVGTSSTISGVSYFNGQSAQIQLESFTQRLDFDMGFVLASFVKGQVLLDPEVNCVVDGTETPYPNTPIMLDGSTIDYFGWTDAEGKYEIPVLPGDYIVRLTDFPIWLNACANNVLITAPQTQFTFVEDLLVYVAPCPILEVSMSSNLLRRCFSTNVYWVLYENKSPVPAVNAYVDVTLDPFLTIVESSISNYDSLGNQVYRFYLGDIAGFGKGWFRIRMELSCDAVLGQTHCSTAEIFPYDPICIGGNALWSGALLEATATCDPDSLRFNIKNVGTGDMGNQLEYVIIEDGIMGFMQTSAPLTASGTKGVSVPANGSTWRLEVEQEPLAPTLDRPMLSVEGCTNGSDFSLGYVTQFPNSDADGNIDIECVENRASCDPNDKEGYPFGFGPNHRIDPNTPIEYRVRFQNTGNDTAFTVVIRDTLSPWLDPLSIRPIVASHPFAFSLEGAGVAVFRFEDILLPDSNTNFLGSQGYVRFDIWPRANTPLGSDIFNSAAIYFDYNAPIITNTTQHRIDVDFVPTVSAWWPKHIEHTLVATPNPTSGRVRIQLQGGALPHGDYTLRLTDALGRNVRTLRSTAPVFDLDTFGLAAGAYFVQLLGGGMFIGSGRLIVR